MARFNIGKKKEEKQVSARCCGNSGPKAEKSAGCCAETKADHSAACCCGAPVDGIWRRMCLKAIPQERS